MTGHYPNSDSHLARTNRSMLGKGDWVETTIGEQATLQRGIDITKASQRPGTVPVVSSGGISSFHDTAFAKGPGVVLGRKGVVGSVYYIDSNYWPHDTSLWVRDFHGNDPRFVYYFFKNMAPELASMDVGSANPTLNRNHVHPKAITWPPLPEQRAISYILGTLDDKIELNRKMNETLDEIARTLFTSWFVNFDPVRAKAEGREPEGMDAETAALFPDRLVDSELGMIPEGWETERIGNLVDVSRRSVNPSLFPDEFFDHYSIPAFDNDRRPVEESGASIKSNKTLVDQNTILVSKLNPRIPRVWLPDLVYDRRSICSTEFIVATPIQTETRPFVYGLLTSDPFTNWFAAMVTGTTGSHQRVRLESMLAMPILLPSARLIASFSKIAEPIFDLIAANRHEAVTLSRIRDTVLPQLLSGTLHTLGLEGIWAGL